MKNNVIELKKEPKFIRARDVQKIFNIARSTVDNWARYGYLTRHKLGRNIFYEEAEVKALMQV